MVLYKTATVSMDKLTFPLDVTYLRENRIDVGVLKAERFLSKPNMKCLNMPQTNFAEDNRIRKRPGRNFKCSKVLV